jgi:hypothetical protein
MEPEKKSKIGPIIYITVCIISIYWFYWFGAIGHH